MLSQEYTFLPQLLTNLLCERTVVVRIEVGNGAFRWGFCRVVVYLRTDLRSQQREAKSLDNDVIPYAVEVATQRVRVFQYTCWNGTDWIGQVNLWASMWISYVS